MNEVRYPPGGALGPRIQHNLQLVYVWSGEAQVWVDGVRFRVGEGESILLLPFHRERFRFARERETHHGWCEVLEPAIEPEVAERLAAAGGEVVRTPRAIGELSARALALRADARWAAREEFACLCGAVLFEFFRAVGLPEPIAGVATGAPAPRAVSTALDAIHREYADLSGGRELASRAGVSPQHLSRLFREHLGVTPVAYLWRVRTERAYDLITATGLPLADVAAQAGFQTPFHLSRRIREAYGASPRELRAARR